VAAAPEAPAPAASVAAAPPPARDTGSEIGPWILIGVSGAVAITGGVLLGLAAKDRSSVENPTHSGDQAPMWTPELQSAQDRALPLSVAGFAALGVGVAGLAAGVIWKVTSDQASTETPTAALDVTPTGLRLRGAF
jgi:hypothetical protein